MISLVEAKPRYRRRGYDRPYGETLRLTGYDIKESLSIEVTGAPLIGVINERHLSRRRIRRRQSCDSRDYETSALTPSV